MGLDGVELVMSVEETFGFEFSDPEVEKIATVGDFYDAVWEKIKYKEQLDNKRCKSSVLFYKIRNLFIIKYKIKRENIKPNSKLESIIPKKAIKDEWIIISRDLKLKLPKLVLPSWLSTLLFLFGTFSILGGIIVSWIAVSYYNLSLVWWLIPFLGIASIILINHLVRPLKTSINQNDIRGLIKEMLLLNFKEFSDLLGTNRQEVERIMRNIITDKAGVKFTEVVPNAHLVYDLGIE